MLSIFWTLLLVSGFFCACLSGIQGLSSALTDGAGQAVTVTLSMGGAICLWSGLAELLQQSGIQALLTKLTAPLLSVLFPKATENPTAADALSGNFCANLLGLGNAATPMGIAAARRMAHSGKADAELCRLVVLNTASIQLLPTSVAALRSSLGCQTPFDILPAVWLTGLASAAAGLLAARILETLWRS